MATADADAERTARRAAFDEKARDDEMWEGAVCNGSFYPYPAADTNVGDYQPDDVGYVQPDNTAAALTLPATSYLFEDDADTAWRTLHEYAAKLKADIARCMTVDAIAEASNHMAALVEVDAKMRTLVCAACGRGIYSGNTACCGPRAIRQ